MDTETVVVYRGGGGNVRSDFLKTFLEENGVPCLVRSNTSVAAHPFTVGPMGEFEIVVASENLERAQNLLESVTSEESVEADGENEES